MLLSLQQLQFLSLNLYSLTLELDCLLLSGIAAIWLILSIQPLQRTSQFKLLGRAVRMISGDVFLLRHNRVVLWADRSRYYFPGCFGSARRGNGP